MSMTGQADHLHLTRREFFGRSAKGIGTAALASLLNETGMAATSDSNTSANSEGGTAGLD